MSEIRDTEVDFLSFPEGLAGGDEKIMSVLSLLALNQQRQVRSQIDTELLVSLNIKLHTLCNVVVHICIIHLYCSNYTVRMDWPMLLLRRIIVSGLG